MSLNRVVICGVNTSKLPNLTEEEKNALFDRIEMGDLTARKEFIEGNVDKYNYTVGIKGSKLSGGQKQRIAIARAILCKPKILILDEATSALDNKSQEYIKKTIDSLVKDHTVMIVAHRLSTIVDADIIHVVKKGKVVDSGTHDELLEKSEIYRSLYKTETLNSN